MFNFHFLRNKFKVKKLFSVAEVKLASQANFTGTAAVLATFRKVRFTLNALRAV